MNENQWATGEPGGCRVGGLKSETRIHKTVQGKELRQKQTLASSVRSFLPQVEGQNQLSRTMHPGEINLTRKRPGHIRRAWYRPPARWGEWILWEESSEKVHSPKRLGAQEAVSAGLSVVWFFSVTHFKDDEIFRPDF